MGLLALDDIYSNVAYILRWFHIIAGVTWIGLLYFFNFINIPFQGGLAGDLKPKVNPALLGRALYFFRWGAMWTFLFGWTLFTFKYMPIGDIGGGLITNADGSISDRALWILYGGTLGTIMWFNVWFIIWPAQKKLLGGMKSGNPPADAPALAKRAGLASKTNTYLSGPMLFAMAAPNNYPSINLFTWVLVTLLGLGFIRMLYKISTKSGQEFI